MGCSKCGDKNSGSRCCLCGQGANKFFPWGSKRKICWRCKDRQEELIEQRKLGMTALKNKL